MKQSKKKEVLKELYYACNQRNNFIFNNEEVKKVSLQIGFSNPFDATKLDSKEKLPQYFIDNDIAVIHLGNGFHKFISGLNSVYHSFEPITDIVQWKYHRSLLNQYNSSESNILSVANNQRILHNFLFGKDKEFNDEEIINRPKTYFPHRTKTSFDYYFNNDKITLHNIQLEIDLTLEYKGVVGVFECKNGFPKDFSIYQLYHPFLYYYNANKDASINGRIKEIYGIYVVRNKDNKGNSVLSLWQYTFNNPLDITSISLIKARKYILIKE